MTTRLPSYAASRRRLLAGLGAIIATPVALSATSSSAPAGAAPALRAECLADLVEMGVVGRADFVAG